MGCAGLPSAALALGRIGVLIFPPHPHPRISNIMSKATSRRRRESFRDQLIGAPAQARASERSGSAGRSGLVRFASLSLTEEDREELASEIDDAAARVLAPFASRFPPGEMRQLALVAHNHMKPAMKEFIQTYSEILKKFRITGTQTTMRMCKTLWGEDNPEVQYGLTCTSGPLGGDAQLAALMCIEDLGALVFFVDPLSAHPHQADIDSLVRLSNVGNVVVCPNPTSAMSMMHTLKMALETGSRGMIPSFFETLESPAVAEYKRQQELALAAAVGAPRAGAAGGGEKGAVPPPMRPTPQTDPSMIFSNLEDRGGDYEDDAWSADDCDDDDEFLRQEPEELLHWVRQKVSALTLEEELRGLEGDARRRASVSSLYGVKTRRRGARARKLMKSVRKSVRNVFGSSLRG